MASEGEAHEDDAAAPEYAATAEEQMYTAATLGRAAAPEPRPELRHSADQRAAAQAAQTEEQRYATTPSPADIRARAEEVRQRALAARARRDEERRTDVPVEGADESALLPLEGASLERRAAEARLSAQPIRRSDDPFGVRPREAEPEPRQTTRSGLFTINKLIHRVAGHGHSQDERQQRAERRDPPDFDDAGGDIPAFLRRQAN